MGKRGRRRRRAETLMEEALLLSLLLTAAWVAALPSPPPCLTETVCTKLGGCACPVATWHMYSPESEICNNNNVTIYGQESRRVCEGCTFIFLLACRMPLLPLLLLLMS